MEVRRGCRDLGIWGVVYMWLMVALDGGNEFFLCQTPFYCSHPYEPSNNDISSSIHLAPPNPKITTHYSMTPKQTILHP